MDQDYIIKCVNCKQQIQSPVEELIYRCSRCQAKFRIEESKGQHPSTKQTWMDKLYK